MYSLRRFSLYINQRSRDYEIEHNKSGLIFPEPLDCKYHVTFTSHREVKGVLTSYIGYKTHLKTFKLNLGESQVPSQEYVYLTQNNLQALTRNSKIGSGITEREWVVSK